MNVAWGRGYSRHSYKNESEKRIAGTSTREDEGGSNSFNTRVMSSTVNLPMEDQPPAKENMKWLLDSGCSDHIVNTDKYFYEYVNLQNEVNIKVGDGFALKSHKIGNIVMLFNVFAVMYSSSKNKKIGYTDTGYKILVNDKVTISRHVQFIEKQEERYIRIEDDELSSVCTEDENVQNRVTNENFDEDEIEFQDTTKTKNEMDHTDIKEVTSSQRPKQEIKLPKKFDEHVVYVNFSNASVPENYEEAGNSEDSSKWTAAMNEELESLKQNKT
ncbi:hypothetical protein QE152_g21553 [Popillia japonica]|uniref:Retrovirus-related Pol polyprotein from transposon TNT 1-94-like beta-barrel domain-containing protein n=1 Tax=Popillia japonica TaxID=7064 RepID=A0AAW1KPY4_POPJA